MAETAAQKKARLKKEAYIRSLENPITSQYDPRIEENAGLNPEMAETQMTSSGVSPKGATGDKGPTGPTGSTGAVVAAKLISTYVDPDTGDIIDVYDDGSEKIRKKGTLALDKVIPAKLISTYVDPETGDIIDVYDDGSEKIRKRGTLLATAAGTLLATAAEEKQLKGQSAYDLLFERFDANGLGALVTPLKDLIQQGLSSSELTLRLRDTDAYKKRFAANAQRVAKGLRALSEAEYIGKEDAYQDIMRRYGLPESYYTRGEMGRQEGFEKIIANDISDVELEDRIATAQKRVLNANPEVTQAIKQFYPDITNADILAYTLDPKNAIENIKRKVTAAEIGGAAIQAGLQTDLTRAEQLQAAGVDKQSATEQYGVIASGLQRGSQLASIYGEDPYTQTTAETERFNLAGAQEARKQRQKITGLEKATFGGQSGISSSALARDRAGAY